MEIPSNPSWGWIVGILITAIVAMAGLIAFIIRHYVNNSISKESYEDAQKALREWEDRCRNCEYAKSVKLEQINKILGELSGVNNIIVQSLASINNSLQLLMLKKNGEKWHDREGIPGGSVENNRE